MKNTHLFLLILVTAILSSPVFAGNNNQTSYSGSHSSSSSESMGKTVTVTSVNGVTTKTTTVIRNGKKEVTKEVTGRDGKTRIIKDGEDDQGEADPEKKDDNSPWLGVRVKELDNNMRGQLKLAKNEGVVVDSVANESPAATSDVRVGDIILSLAGATVSTHDQLREAISRHEIGDTVRLEFLRSGERKSVGVTLSPKPSRDDDDNGGKRNNEKEARDDGGRDNRNEEKFKEILNNPDVPDGFKQKIREMMKDMKPIEGGAQTESISISTSDKDLKQLLDDPDLPKEFRSIFREMNQKLENLQRK